MNRKFEGISNLVAVLRARIRGDLEALGAHGKSLEALSREAYDEMTIEEWAHCKEIADRAQVESIEGLSALGFKPAFNTGVAGVVKREGASNANPRAGGKASAAARRAAIAKAALIEPEDDTGPEDPKTRRGEVVAADGGIPGAARRTVREEADG